jgi:ferrous iron transport protein B
MVIFNKYFDKIALHKFYGYFVFIAILYVVFFITFQAGFLSVPIENLITLISDIVSNFLIALNSPEWFVSFIVDGAIAGVGGIIVFLPQIIVMFALLTLLEGIGYFSRVSALFEHLFERIGLSSHSLIPYISGFGCNVFSVVSTRTIKSEPKRIATILSIPFISCSARLPVYLIFTEVFFNENQALILLFLYLTGIAVAIIVAYVIDKFVYNDRPSLTIHTLPSYKRVSLSYFTKVVYRKSLIFVKKAGVFILIGSMLLWLVSHISLSGYTSDVSESILTSISSVIAVLFVPLGFGTPEAVASLLSAFLAKELAVSSMLIMYQVSSVSELSAVVASSYNAASALSFMVFTLLYIPCLSTLAVIKSETGSIKFVIYSALMSFGIGYTVAFVVYHIAKLFI